MNLAFRRGEGSAWALLAVFVVALGGYNARLIYDDIYLITYFKIIHNSHFGFLPTLILNLDLAPAEYRLYGFSRLLHYILWSCFGSQAWFYGSVISATQVAAGYGISRLLLRAGADRFQANLGGVVCSLSAFIVTSCFHHYSYLILPYQLTIFCALVIKRRKLVLGISIAIALSGEAHLAGAATLLLLAALIDKERSLRTRLTDAALPISAMFLTVVTHRLIWLYLVGDSAAPTRYNLSFPTRTELIERTGRWLNSLFPGMTTQIFDIFTFSGGWALFGFLMVILASAFVRFVPKPGSDAGWRIPLGLAAIFLSSLAILWALSAFSGQVSAALPRRYGYVPNTIFVVLVVVTLSAPRIRARLSAGPAIAAAALSISIWGLLECVTLPLVNIQDGRVWDVLRGTLKAKGDGAGVLFVSASDWSATQVDELKKLDSVSFRGDPSEVLESPFSGYAWEAEYSIVVAGAAFAAHRWRTVDEDHVELFGNGLNFRASRLVEKKSVVVFFDERPAVRPLSDPRAITTFMDWDKFHAAVTAKGLKW
ncbi:MAG TPA: hypothetical protein VGC77_10120 [Rhodopseudomonas sp.]|uniref:hypothetical protein n=1 Tax=Rhodopseudomonas sp. TaxID=1078 RepID=UPI002ED79A25